ncbi:MAG: hypothetical protein IT285_06875 [Bdellovibrionales bacterium]|nr:hypothetical protein [Bdellovibrionales bacterium]
MRLAVVVLAVGLLSPGAAMAKGELPGFSVSAGLLGRQVLSTAADDDGSSGMFGTLLPALGFSASVSLSGSFGLRPSALYTPLGRTAANDSASVRFLSLEIPVGYLGGGGLDWHAGPGVLMTIISGEGGLVEIENGTGTADFARPGGTSTSTVLMMTAGVSTRITGNWRAGVDGWIYGLAGGRGTVDLVARLNLGF